MIDIIRFPVPESGSTVFPRIFPRRGGDEGADAAALRNAVSSSLPVASPRRRRPRNHRARFGMKPPDPFGIMLMGRKRFFALHGSRFAWSML
jgi:hypothetical protein